MINLTASTSNTSSAPAPAASPQRCTGQPVHQEISSASPCALGTPRRHSHLHQHTQLHQSDTNTSHTHSPATLSSTSNESWRLIAAGEGLGRPPPSGDICLGSAGMSSYSVGEGLGLPTMITRPPIASATRPARPRTSAVGYVGSRRAYASR